MAGLIEDNRRENDPRTGYDVELPMPNTVAFTAKPQDQITMPDPTQVGQNVVASEQPVTDISPDIIPAATPLQQQTAESFVPNPITLQNQVLNDYASEVDWAKSNLDDLPITQYADFSATDGLMQVMQLQPYEGGVYVPPGMPEDPALAAKREELRARGYDIDPTGNIVNASGGMGSKAKDGWQIGDVVNQVLSFPSFLNKAGVIKFDPSAPGNVLGFTLGALGKGIAQGDVGKGFQQEFKPDQFNQFERSAIQALQPTDKRTNPFQGTFGDYGTGVIGGINYAMDNFFGGNAVRGVIADVKQNQQRARQGQAPEWNGLGSALRGKSYSFVDQNSPLNVTGTDKKGWDFWKAFGGGLALDTLTDINPLNAVRKLGVGSLKAAAKQGAQQAAVQGGRGAVARQIARETIKGLDNPLLDIGMGVGGRLLKGKGDDAARLGAGNTRALTKRGTTALDNIDDTVDGGRALLESRTLPEPVVRGLLTKPKDAPNAVNKTPLLKPPRRLQPGEAPVPARQVRGKPYKQLRLDANGKAVVTTVEPKAAQAQVNPLTVAPTAKPKLVEPTLKPDVPKLEAPKVESPKFDVNNLGDEAVESVTKQTDEVSPDAPKTTQEAPDVPEGTNTPKVEADAPQVKPEVTQPTPEVKPPMVEKLQEIMDEVNTRGLSDENAKLIADPVAAPTILEAAQKADVLKVKEGGVITRASEEIEAAQRELIRLRIEQNAVKNTPNFDLRKDLQQRFFDIQENINQARKTITGGRELRTDFDLTEELVDSAIPVVPMETFVPATNPSLLYQQLKNLSPGQRVYTNTAEYVERSNAELTELARFLGHYNGPRKQPLNTDQLAELRYTYGSVYSPVGHPIDSKAIKQYLKTGVARVETKKGNKVVGIPQETQVINRAPEVELPDSPDIQEQNLMQQLETELNGLYEQANKLDPEADTDALMELDARIDEIEGELNRMYMAETVGTKEYKQFESALPDNKKPTTPEGKEAVQGVYQAELDVEEAMSRVRVLSEELEAVKLMVDDDMGRLYNLPKVEPQQLDVGSHYSMLNERVLNARKPAPKAVPVPPEKLSPLTESVRSSTWFTGTKFEVEALGTVDPALVSPTRNPLGLGHYFYSDPDMATDVAKAAIPDNTPYTDLPVSETGFVREVAPVVESTLDANAPITKEVRDLFVEAAKEAGMDDATIRSFKSRLTTKKNKQVVIAEAWNKLTAAYAKANPDLPIPEDMFRQFELNVQAKMEDLGVDSIRYTDGASETLVVFGNKFDELAVTPVGTGDVTEQALSAVNVANAHKQITNDIVGKTNAVNARIRFGMELQTRLAEMLEEATIAADTSISRMLDADEAAEAIVKTEKENAMLRKLQDGAKEYAAEIEAIIKVNDEYPGCL